MRKPMGNRILGWLLALLLLLSLPVPAEAAEKYMEGESADFQIVLDENGGADITETWNCFFGGDTITRYRRFYSLPEDQNMDLEILEVSMDGEPMELLEEADDSRPEGCAFLDVQPDRLGLELYLNALNESHSFEIHYYVTNAVQLYNDAAEFHWTLTSENEAFDLAEVTGFIEIPYGTQDMGLYFWGHGPAENAFFDAIVDEDGMVNEFTLYTENVPRDRAVTVRFAMPRELFPGCTRIQDWDGLPEILEQEHADPAAFSGGPGETEEYEETFADTEEDYDQSFQNLPWWEKFFSYLEDAMDMVFGTLFGILRLAAMIMAFLPPALLLLFRKSIARRGKKKYLPDMYEKHRKKPFRAPQYYRSLPDDMKPAMVYKLMSIYPATEEGEAVLQKGNAFSATVLDLVEAGILQLRSREDGEMAYSVTPKAAAADLTPWERNVVELYTAAGADREPKTTREITDYMREEYSWCKTHYQAFQDLVDSEFQALGLSTDYPQKPWDRKRHVRVGVKCGLVVAVGLLWSKGLGAIWLGTASGIINSLVLSRLDALRHPEFQLLTQEGEDRYALWKAYGDFLRDFTVFEEREAEDVRVWRKYLVYATALGCSEKVTEQLRIRLPQVYNSLLWDYGSSLDSFRYDDMVGSVTTIDTENGYTIRSSHSYGGDWSSSSDSGSDWGGFSDSGGDSDSGSSGSDFD